LAACLAKRSRLAPARRHLRQLLPQRLVLPAQGFVGLLLHDGWHGDNGNSNGTDYDDFDLLIPKFLRWLTLLRQ